MAEARVRGARIGGDRGTVLLLMPAVLLALLVLGAIAVDSAVALLAQRNLVAATGDASNDAASIALDRRSLLGGEPARLTPTTVATAVEHVLRRNGINDAVIERVDVTADGRAAEIRVRRTVRLVFAPLLPHAARSTTVAATVRVTNLER